MIVTAPCSIPEHLADEPYRISLRFAYSSVYTDNLVKMDDGAPGSPSSRQSLRGSLRVQIKLVQSVLPLALLP